MRIRPRALPIAFLVCSLAAVSDGAAQEKPAAPTEWTVDRSLLTFGSVESNSGFPFGLGTTGEVEPSTALSLSANLDASRGGGWGRVRMAGYAFMRSPESDRYRSYFIAGRLSYSRPIGSWRFHVDDAAKWQRRPQLDVANLGRNDLNAGIEFQLPHSVGLLAQVSDRQRRYDTDINYLNYNRQAVRTGMFGAPAPRVRAEGSFAWQRYDSFVATGRRLVFGGEVAAFPGRTVLNMKYAYFSPRNDERKLELFGPPNIPPGVEAPEEVLYLDVLLAQFMELLALQSAEAELAGEPFILDPAETDNDEWDFGRRKHVGSFTIAHRFDDRSSVSGMVRYQWRSGPLLLNPEYLAPDIVDDRVLLRVMFRQQVTRRLRLLLQVSHLRNSGDRDYAIFSRTLGALGLQVRF